VAFASNSGVDPDDDPLLAPLRERLRSRAGRLAALRVR
jgi:hypothetical protein